MPEETSRNAEGFREENVRGYISVARSFWERQSKRKKIIFVIAGAVIIGLAFFGSSGNLSEDQKETVGLLGNPEQFGFMYLPQGEEGENLARFEVWYYPATGKKISFLAGEVFSAEDYKSATAVASTTLNPQDFGILMDYKDVSKVLGEKIVEFDWPGFTGGTLKTYISDKAVFAIENDALVYFETIGLKK